MADQYQIEQQNRKLQIDQNLDEYFGKDFFNKVKKERLNVLKLQEEGKNKEKKQLLDLIKEEILKNPVTFIYIGVNFKYLDQWEIRKFMQEFDIDTRTYQGKELKKYKSDNNIKDKDGNMLIQCRLTTLLFKLDKEITDQMLKDKFNDPHHIIMQYLK